MRWFGRKEPPSAVEKKEDPSSWFSTQTSAGDPTWDRSKRYLAAVQKSFQRSHDALKLVDPKGNAIAMDEGMKIAMDNNIQQVKQLIGTNSGFLPIHQIEWYSSQGFIGWQMCGIIAQQWLVDKSCKMPAQDAVRHGWELSVNDGAEVAPEVFDKIRKWDKKFRLKANLIEHFRFARIFGLRHTLFLVDGIDYEAPFNPDGVRPGSYRGMTQIDPYWLAPEFSIEDASDPASPNFYNPTWWRVNGKRVHRSHFVISRNGSELADILKPSYFYGGISTVQKIMERVYAAERTANEAPMLAMTKRLITLTIDLSQAMGNPEKLREKLDEWMGLLNNFGVKVVGPGDKVEQFDTNLTGLDETIMTQFQLVAAAAEVPATKLLGTSPKGFNATGEYEQDSYHEFLESIQENELTPLIERHTLLVCRSFLDTDQNFEVQWMPTDSPSAKDIAEINKIKADTAKTLADAGAVDGTDIRQQVSKDRDSGFNGIPEIVPGGPGDREAAEEAEGALEQPLTAKAKAGAENNAGNTDG